MWPVKTHSQEERPLIHFGLLLLAEASDPIYRPVSKLPILHIVVRHVKGLEADRVAEVTPVVDCTSSSRRVKLRRAPSQQGTHS